MKIEGMETLKRRGVFVLVGADGATVELTVSALPLTFHGQLVQELPAPEVPMKVIGQSGKDGTLRTEKNPEDAKYISRMHEVNTLQMAAYAYTALRDEPKVRWTAHRDNFDKAEDFYRAIYEEMCELGWTLEDLTRLSKAVAAIDNLDDKLIEEAATRFLRRAEGDEQNSTSPSV